MRSSKLVILNSLAVMGVAAMVSALMPATAAGHAPARTRRKQVVDDDVETAPSGTSTRRPLRGVAAEPEDTTATDIRVPTAERLYVSLQPKMSAQLNSLNADLGGSKSDTVNRAISLLAYVQERVSAGEVIGFASPDRKTFEVVHLL